MGKRACGFVIFRRIQGQIQYLLMQTSYGEHHWTPPKGHTKSGETDLQTAYRETQEEAGLTKEDLKIYDGCRQEMRYLVRDKPKTVIYWLAELINNTKTVTMSDEHRDFKWLPIAEACDVVGYEEMQTALKACDKYIAEKLAI